MKKEILNEHYLKAKSNLDLVHNQMEWIQYNSVASPPMTSEWDRHRHWLRRGIPMTLVRPFTNKDHLEHPHTSANLVSHSFLSLASCNRDDAVARHAAASAAHP